MAEDERGWVRRLQRGEVDAFDALYASYGDRIYYFCVRLCGNTTDAEDLAQEVFLAAFQGLERFAGRSSVATWLYRIALYRWQRLHGGPRPELLPLDDARTAAVTPDPAREGTERLSLEAALAALPEPLRVAFLLVKSEGLKYREAAAVLGVPQGTIQSRVHDAVLRLQTLLSEPSAEADCCPAAPPIAAGPKGVCHEV